MKGGRESPDCSRPFRPLEFNKIERRFAPVNAFTSNATVYKVQANDRFYLRCSVAPISSHGQSQKLDRVWMNFVDTSADSWSYLRSCRRSSAAAIDVLFGIYRNATNFMALDRGCRVSPAGIIPESHCQLDESFGRNSIQVPDEECRLFNAALSNWMFRRVSEYLACGTASRT